MAKTKTKGTAKTVNDTPVPQPITISSTNPKIMADNIKKLEKAIKGADDASEISYDNTTSHLTASNVQAAIDEVVSGLTSPAASDVTYDNTDSGLTADDVQDAIDEISSNLNSMIPAQALFTPHYGASSDLAARNFFLTDNATFLEVHFCLRCQTAISAGVDLITLPTIAQNKTPQYGVGVETSNNKVHLVYNDDNYIYLDGLAISEDFNGVFAGTFRMSLV